MRTFRAQFLFVVLFFIFIYCGHSHLLFKKLKSSQYFFSKIKSRLQNTEFNQNLRASTFFSDLKILVFSSLLINFPILSLVLLPLLDFDHTFNFERLIKVLSNGESQAVFLQALSHLFQSNHVKENLLLNELNKNFNSSNHTFFFEPQATTTTTFSPLSSLIFSSLHSNHFNNLLSNLLNQLFLFNNNLKNSRFSEKSMAEKLNNLSSLFLNEKHSDLLQTKVNRAPPFSKPSNSHLESSKPSKTFFKYIHSILITIKDGIQKYDLSENECQTRLICDLYNKVISKSLKSWITIMFELFGFEKLISTSFTARTKSILKDFYEIAKKRLNEEDCVTNYSKCPVSIAVEPSSNSLMANFFQSKKKI